MNILIEKRYKEERYIAYSAIERVKAASIAIESNDPTHKHGIKYKISKKDYDDIIDLVFNQRCERHMNKNLIKDFINTKLKKL